VKLYRKAKFIIASIFHNRVPSLYSTLDSPAEVPIQVAAYRLARQEYIQTTDSVLDVGFGLGYGLGEMAEKASHCTGIEVDRRAVQRGQRLIDENGGVVAIEYYDGRTIPYGDDVFDVVTCVDVIEHVPDYVNLLREMLRVSKRVVLISTPNRRRCPIHS